MSSENLAIRDQRQPGWFFVDNEVIDQYSQRLGAYGVAVYNVLSRYAKNGSQQVNLSARDIAIALGISQDRVRKSFVDLADVGLIHLHIPTRPAPGLITKITLLNVKKELNATRSVNRSTERYTFSSPHELNATRGGNKEVKTKTETETNQPRFFRAQKPSDHQFVGATEILPPCPLNFCDGSGWYVDENRQRMNCQCRSQMEIAR